MLAISDIQELCRQSSSVASHVREDYQDDTASAAHVGVFSRGHIVTLIALILTSILLFRLIYLNTFNTPFLASQMQERIERTIKITAMRGTMIDRNNVPLAVSTPVASIWVDPSDLDELSTTQVKQVADILNMPLSALNDKLNQKDKTFVYLKREVSPDVARQIKALDIAGIYSLEEFKRYYPDGEITAHVVGFDNVDDRGADGMEYANDKALIGVDGVHTILRDRQGHVVEEVGAAKQATNGHTVKLSIDSRIQYIAYSALKNQVNKLQAKGGSAIVLDAKTGEVLSMVNMPTYNPNNREGVTPDMLKNRAATNVYDPGSIMKPLVIAKAFDDHLVTPQTIINTHPYHVGPKLIKDDEPFPELSVEDVLIHSSDIGTSKIALKYKPQALWDYYRKVGLGEKLGTGFPGETSGRLLNWQKWRPMDQALMSFGYGIAVSLFQMAHAYTIFTNNGCLLPVSFYPENSNAAVKCQQVIRPSTAATIREILAKNTERGTGINARVDGYTTAGKTGTAQKLINGHYSNHAHIGSFVGFAPVNNPRIIVAVMIDNPTHGGYYASEVAAPVFSQITGDTLRLLGVKPDKPMLAAEGSTTPPQRIVTNKNV